MHLHIVYYIKGGIKLKFTINKPSVWMYQTEDLCGEVSDELLLGTVIEIISENDTCVLCETDYGYSGYINKWELCECDREDCADNEKRYIYSKCDVLPSPEYKYAPIMSLPKGAKVLVPEKYDERFSSCIIGKRKYYVQNQAFERKEQTNFADAFVNTAESYIGTPYRWGGKSDSGIDCSGLVFMSARLCGKNVYRDAVPKAEYINIIKREELKKGDLIYFKGHVVIYAGNGNIIHSSARKGKVLQQTLYESFPDESEVLCYARIK